MLQFPGMCYNNKTLKQGQCNLPSPAKCAKDAFDTYIERLHKLDLCFKVQ